MRSEFELVIGEGGEPPAGLPLRLAKIHREADADDHVMLKFRWAESVDPVEVDRTPDVADLVVWAGFEITRSRIDPPRDPGSSTVIEATRLRTLPDYVSDAMDILICGLNPSLNSADLKVGFGRAGNRFWPAALDAGLLSIDRDPVDALVEHRVGMTDLVKRATPRAASLTTDEYAAGVRRLDRLCDWLKPDVVCMVGLAGWRAAVDRKAVAGVQSRRIGHSMVYVMPSTSGLNASSSLADLTEHLTRAADPGQRRPEHGCHTPSS